MAGAIAAATCGRRSIVPQSEQLERFERLIMPHARAGYNLARWLTGDPHDAEDVVQEAMVRAMRAVDRFHGGDARCWLLTIVRNTCYSWMKQNRKHQPAALPDEDLLALESISPPDAALLRAADAEMVRDAINSLPPEFREVLVMREMEGLSYKEIAAVTDLPPGTVMSRLSRARERLEQLLAPKVCEEA
jgi:RNA polymerase sigma-70 factor (ECF subfamily)